MFFASARHVSLLHEQSKLISLCEWLPRVLNRLDRLTRYMNISQQAIIPPELHAGRAGIRTMVFSRLQAVG